MSIQSAGITAHCGVTYHPRRESSVKQEVAISELGGMATTNASFTGDDIEFYDDSCEQTSRDGLAAVVKTSEPASSTRRRSPAAVQASQNQLASLNGPAVLQVPIKADTEASISIDPRSPQNSDTSVATAVQILPTTSNDPQYAESQDRIRVVMSKRSRYPRRALIGISSELSVPQRMTARQALNIARNIKRGSRYVESAHVLGNERRHALECMGWSGDRWITKEEALWDATTLFMLAYCRDEVMQRIRALKGLIPRVVYVSGMPQRIIAQEQLVSFLRACGIQAHNGAPPDIASDPSTEDTLSISGHSQTLHKDVDWRHILKARHCSLYDFWQSFDLLVCRKLNPFWQTLNSGGGLSPYCFKAAFGNLAARGVTFTASEGRIGEGENPSTRDPVSNPASSLLSTKKRKLSKAASNAGPARGPARKQRKPTKAMNSARSACSISAKPKKPRTTPKKIRKGKEKRVKLKDMGRADLSVAEEAAVNSQRRVPPAPGPICVAIKREHATAV